MIDRLVVLNDSGFAAGGATALAIACAVGARKALIPVTYVTAAGPVDAGLIAAGVDVIQIPGPPITAVNRFGGVLQGLYRQSSFHAVKQWIQDNDTPRTIYHLHNWSRFLSPSVFQALGAISSRLVLTLHDFFLSCPNGAQFSYTENTICKRVPNSLSCLTHNCDHRSYTDKLWRSARLQTRKILFDIAKARPRVIAIHEGMIPALTAGGVPVDCIQVIRNPIKPFTTSQIDITLNKEVLFVGQLTYQKGPDLAINAAQRAGLSIRLIGDGPMMADLKKMMPTAIFEGWRSREEIGRWCKQSRMLVMPSRWPEPYGMVAGEALWSGLPVIVSNRAFISVEISQSGSGISCDTEDVDRFSAAMLEIKKDDLTAIRMSNNAYTQTRSIGNTIEKWEELNLNEYRKGLTYSLGTSVDSKR